MLLTGGSDRPDVSDAAQADELFRAERQAGIAGRELGRALEVAVGPWIEGLVLSRHRQAGELAVSQDRGLAQDLARQAAAIIERDALPLVLDALSPESAATPLALLRRSTGAATAALRDLGVPEVVRDSDAERLFPDDVFDLVPGSWSDISDDLAQLGLRWSASVALVALARNRDV